jgi:hypothetical protein
MSRDPEQFRFRHVTFGDGTEGVVLVCLTCNQHAYGDRLDPIGKSTGGAEGDDDLETVLFQADEHRTLYCGGPRE